MRFRGLDPRWLRSALHRGRLGAVSAELWDESYAADYEPYGYAVDERRPAVTVEQRTLPTDWPAGEFDVIVASDVFSYWTPCLVREAVRRCEDSLAPARRRAPRLQLAAVHAHTRAVGRRRPPDRPAYDDARARPERPARRASTRLLRQDAASRASLTSRSASSLCSLRTAVYDTFPISRASRAAWSDSSRSAAFFTLYSPFICLTSSSESDTTSTSGTASSIAFSSPATSPRYSATLFVATPIRSPCAASTVPS